MTRRRGRQRGNRDREMDTTLDSTLIEQVLRGYRTEAHVRVRLPGGGALNIDRKLPYLFVYRQPPGRRDDGTAKLVLGEASYLIVGDDNEDATSLVRAIATAGTEELGSFLVLELWAGDADSNRFVIHAPEGPAAESIDALRTGLEEVSAQLGADAVVLLQSDERHAADMPPLLTTRESWETGSLLLGLEVPPLFRDAEGSVYPVFLRRMRTMLSPALRQAAFEFARVQTTAGFQSYRALGPRSVGEAVFDIDAELAAVERSYQFLLLVSPLNSSQALQQFEARGCDRLPEFKYRLLPVDPDVLLRRLFNIDLDDAADPALAFLLRDKRDELARQVTMLAERNTADFLYASIRLYRPVDELLVRVARELLDTVVPERRPADGVPLVSADEFAQLARGEIEYYRHSCPDIAADVQVRPDLTGLMVSRGDLLIGERLALDPARVDALLHHEVGTHVLTYYNGLAQPLRQLSTGLAGYDELQEGLAVFSEYLAGGLGAVRMRVLAARVLAAHSVEQGADFIETFRLLTRDCGFSNAGAFDIAERVHACGGFTRDVIYLRGLLRLVEYLRAGGALAPLYIGKIAAKHVDVVAELGERGFLVPMPIVPRLFEEPTTAARIEAVRRGLSITEMINGST
jgi:uncharacterized protein (TIGR02421 family)